MPFLREWYQKTFSVVKPPCLTTAALTDPCDGKVESNIMQRKNKVDLNSKTVVYITI